ncbi:hypothetical protein VOLCADRAFT_92266 [Volvox carteri f. nagariensis]|uniref:UDENN domain-containing protein n=1 Tax=Volvox carteri f. nagariensis TaxID=3068 RepID=D8TZ74_VOLCA|nr:uncharacterized protein VOLCADRAFT_92266 [Volvox carteri f. nagariensis]EFJ47226.1 hypothetical protein VOLCADRAFT_92266 [Volvox carteri f. nagariensis]|eukprot:XP_002951775.1 hypothetical protein VOLCADRAFT_92266 [Volvox carteri f. nagariensis]
MAFMYRFQGKLCCMPDGVEIVSAERAEFRLRSSDYSPVVYSLVLTDEGGRRLYGTCLTYLEPLPPIITCRHEHLIGAYGTRALCLVSKLPYLTTAEQVLRGLFSTVFLRGPSAPVADLLGALLRLPCPGETRREVDAG